MSNQNKIVGFRATLRDMKNLKKLMKRWGESASGAIKRALEMCANK